MEGPWCSQMFWAARALHWYIQTVKLLYSYNIPLSWGIGNLWNYYRAGDRRLQLYVLNEEFLVITRHYHVMIMSLPFVHTARRWYRLNGLVRCGEWIYIHEPPRTMSFRGIISRNKARVEESALGSIIHYRAEWRCYVNSIETEWDYHLCDLYIVIYTSLKIQYKQTKSNIQCKL